MSDCTCKPPSGPPRHESMTFRHFKYAVRLDSWEDDSEIDPACPYHGENGSMVAIIHTSRHRQIKGR